jgi:hypothetical protein
VGQTEELVFERVFNIFPIEGLIKRVEYGTLLVLFVCFDYGCCLIVLI